MTYWPAWLSGIALALIPIIHWLVVRRMLAVSGRFTQLVNRVREGAPEADAGPEMSEEELIAAVQAMALAEFGADALDGADAASEGRAAPEPAAPATLGPPPQPLWVHAGFLLALTVGGAISALLAGGIEVDPGLASAGFEAAFSNQAVGSAVLLFGGILVGWGTRMAGGCTSGHGLCGVSRFQPGSLVATAAFFGTGIAVSLLMDAIL